MFEATAQPAPFRRPRFRSTGHPLAPKADGRVPGRLCLLSLAKKSKTAASRQLDELPHAITPATPRASAPPSLQPYLTPCFAFCPIRPSVLASKFKIFFLVPLNQQQSNHHRRNKIQPLARTTKAPKRRKTTPQSPPTTKSWC